MARQARLLPDPAATILVAPGRDEPSLWVRRLVVWQEPGNVIRDIPLRRGLNIVWSPDPGAPLAGLGHSGGTGHGAGKTLFCRLLRYCLGEETFADDRLRRTIASAFPEGLVGAEVVVRGTPQSVIRPIGLTRKNLAGEGTLEDVLEEGRGDPGLRGIREYLVEETLPDGIEARMPGHGEWKSWLLALAWLSRDQECRFGHLLEWRHTRAESKSPAVGLTKDQTLTAVRLFLDVMTSAELDLRGQRDSVPARKHRTEQDIAYLSRVAEQLAAELARELEFDSGLAGIDGLAPAAFRQRAAERLKEVARHPTPDRAGPELARIQKELETVIGRRAVVTDQVERTISLIAIQEEQRKALRGERANLDAEQIKATLGPVCPVCGVPIDKALADGCGLSHVVRDPAEIDTSKNRTDDQLEACTGAIAEYNRQKSEGEAILRDTDRRETELRQAIAELEKAAAKARTEYDRRIFEAQRLVDRAGKLEVLHARLDASRKQLGQLDREEEQFQKKLQAQRSRHRAALRRLDELFRHTCRMLLDPNVEASLKLTGQGLQAEVGRGGMAMDSLKAIAFDLAVLMMGVEGHSGLPAFLVHDSPREADLGLSHYHRLFRLMANLEALGKEPPFQYIVTTTTAPPDELSASPYLTVKLDGSVTEERLMRRDLR